MLAHIEVKRKLRAYENGLLRRIFGPNRGDVSIPVSVRSKAWVCGRSPVETVGLNPVGGMDVCLL
jgi:hypothetical protein